MSQSAWIAIPLSETSHTGPFGALLFVGRPSTLLALLYTLLLAVRVPPPKSTCTLSGCVDIYRPFRALYSRSHTLSYRDYPGFVFFDRPEDIGSFIHSLKFLKGLSII